MGGGDLNMKKSWHPVLLSNQAKVWEVEKKAHEEKKKLEQLRKELEEERQLQELQRLQEESTGKKRVDKLEWMYASPATAEGGALGGAKLGEQQMEDYLLGKRRVDDVLKQNEENIGATSEKFQAVQNANNALDIAAKIREDPLLAIKRQEQLTYQAMMNNPALRKQVKDMKRKKEETKEEKKERKRREKDEKKAAKKEAKYEQRSHRRPAYSDSEGSRSEEYSSRQRSVRPRSRSPRRDGWGKYDDPYRSQGRSYHDETRRDRSPYRGGDPYRREVSPRRNSRRDERDYRRDDRDYGRPRMDDRTPARQESNAYHRSSNRPDPLDFEDVKPLVKASPASTNRHDDARAARLTQMAADAQSHTTSRLESLEQRRIKEEQHEAQEKAERARTGDTKGSYVREQERMMMGGPGGMGLGDVLGRRNGKGLVKAEF